MFLSSKFYEIKTFITGEQCDSGNPFGEIYNFAIRSVLFFVVLLSISLIFSNLYISYVH